MSESTLPRIIAIPSNPSSRISAYIGLLDLMRLDVIQAPRFGQNLEEVLFLSHFKQFPFEYALLDLNFEPQFSTLSPAMSDKKPPHDMQTGHYMALMFLRANPTVRCVICADNARDEAQAGHIERTVFRDYPGRVKHIPSKSARLHGRVSTGLNEVEWCDAAHLTPDDPVVVDWVKAAAFAFPDAEHVFRRREMANA